ncbi:ATP-grasp domain-containing protein [Bacillus wiedmannii]
MNNVIFCEYQQTRKYLDLIDVLKEENFDAIVAGLEYAVVATNDIAKELNLPFAGENIANFLTNKLMLRNFCHINGISQPNYRQVRDLADIQDFFRGAPIVLKPANRQASLGVIKISNKEEIFQAWNEVINIDETNQIPNREMKWEYLVEDCMVGIEISSEVFVKNKQLLFINNTEKKITSGRYSVEIAHLVPARISVETSKLLFDYIKK